MDIPDSPTKPTILSATQPALPAKLQLGPAKGKVSPGTTPPKKKTPTQRKTKNAEQRKQQRFSDEGKGITRIELRVWAHAANRIRCWVAEQGFYPPDGGPRSAASSAKLPRPVVAEEVQSADNHHNQHVEVPAPASPQPVANEIGHTARPVDCMPRPVAPVETAKVTQTESPSSDQMELFP